MIEVDGQGAQASYSYEVHPTCKQISAEMSNSNVSELKPEHRTIPSFRKVTVNTSSPYIYVNYEDH